MIKELVDLLFYDCMIVSKKNMFDLYSSTRRPVSP